MKCSILHENKLNHSIKGKRRYEQDTKIESPLLYAYPWIRPTILSV